MKSWKDPLKTHGGVTLMAVGVLLLIICRVAGWQSNAELLTGLALVVLGFIAHVWSQKGGQKY